MLKKFALATAAAVAFAAVPAQAATVVYVTDDGVNGDGIIEFAPSSGGVTGGFSFKVEADNEGPGFVATYQFDNTFFNPAAGSATLIFDVSAAGADLVFTGATLAGGAGNLVINNAGNPLSTVYVFNAPIPLGMNTLTFTGNLANGASSSTASGTLSLAPVPEPTTWALMILGFGAVGSAMRRRASKVQSAKATLHFA
jgi:hypothetical protein